MNLLEVIRARVKNFDKIDVNPIFDEDQNKVGFHAISYLKDGFPFSGGTHSSQQIAIRICIAEALERTFFFNILLENNNDFLTNEFPSTCGFACGFEFEKTKYRAICEAIERWAWSKWIDDGFKLNIKFDVKLDSLSNALSMVFVKKKYYSIKLNILDMTVQFCVFIGETENGIFAGSRVCNINENPWTHAVAEAFRNFRNYETHQSSKLNSMNEDIVRRRAIYFGSHKIEAQNQIENAIKLHWPQPSIRILKEFKTGIPQVYLWRCLLNDWLDWDSGDETRFVY